MYTNLIYNFHYIEYFLVWNFHYLYQLNNDFHLNNPESLKDHDNNWIVLNVLV